jgi:hypothetical protein
MKLKYPSIMGLVILRVLMVQIVRGDALERWVHRMSVAPFMKDVLSRNVDTAKTG